MRCCTVCCTRCCYLPVLVTPLAPLTLLCRPAPLGRLAVKPRAKANWHFHTFCGGCCCRGLGNLHFRFYRTHTGSSNTHTHTHNSCAILCVAFVSVSLLTCKLQLQLYRCTFCLLPCGSFLGYTAVCCPLGVCYKERQQEQETAANTEAAVKLRRDRGSLLSLRLKSMFGFLVCGCECVCERVASGVRF